MILKEKTFYSFLAWVIIFAMGLAVGISVPYIPKIKHITIKIFEGFENKLLAQHETASNNSINDFFSIPKSFFYINRSGYSLVYDAKNRNPLWVREYLTNESLVGDSSRHKFNFKEDDNIPEPLRAKLSDYIKQGFDRGHLAPAADHKANEQVMSDTFYLTNMCPQNPSFNRSYWAKLEKYVRDLTSSYLAVAVITGPLYLSYLESDGKRYVKYQVIGENEVAVPTHFYKILTLETQEGNKEIEAYLLPNQPIAHNIPLSHFKTTVNKIEKVAGVVFFPLISN